MISAQAAEKNCRGGVYPIKSVRPCRVYPIISSPCISPKSALIVFLHGGRGHTGIFRRRYSHCHRFSKTEDFNLITHPSSSPLLPHTSSPLPHPVSLSPPHIPLTLPPSSLAPHGLIPHILSLTPSPSFRNVTEKITNDKFCKIMERKKMKILKIGLTKFWIQLRIRISLKSGIRIWIRIKTF